MVRWAALPIRSDVSSPSHVTSPGSLGSPRGPRAGVRDSQGPRLPPVPPPCDAHPFTFCLQATRAAIPTSASGSPRSWETTRRSMVGRCSAGGGGGGCGGVSPPHGIPNSVPVLPPSFPGGPHGGYHGHYHDEGYGPPPPHYEGRRMGPPVGGHRRGPSRYGPQYGHPPPPPPPPEYGPHADSPVLMVYGLDQSKMNCDRVFNIFCLYGNVEKVSGAGSPPHSPQPPSTPPLRGAESWGAA